MKPPTLASCARGLRRCRGFSTASLLDGACARPPGDPTWQHCDTEHDRVEVGVRLLAGILPRRAAGLNVGRGPFANPPCLSVVVMDAGWSSEFQYKWVSHSEAREIKGRGA